VNALNVFSTLNAVRALRRFASARDCLYSRYTEQIANAVFEPSDLYARTVTVHSHVKVVIRQREMHACCVVRV
jgi:hypothetical protein